MLLQRFAPGSLLDVGCGSGVLAIAAALLGFSPVTAVDIEQAAVDATRANARVNGVMVEVAMSAWTTRCRRLRPSSRTSWVPAVAALVARIEARTLVTSGYLQSNRLALHGWRTSSGSSSTDGPPTFTHEPDAAVRSTCGDVRVDFLGCKVSHADAQEVREALLADGHVERHDGEVADVAVISGCCVTNEAVALRVSRPGLQAEGLFIVIPAMGIMLAFAALVLWVVKVDPLPCEQQGALGVLASVWPRACGW